MHEGYGRSVLALCLQLYLQCFFRSFHKLFLAPKYLQKLVPMITVTVLSEILQEAFDHAQFYCETMFLLFWIVHWNILNPSGTNVDLFLLVS